MRIFPITAKYVSLLAETLKGVTGFLVPYICIIILFADAYMILNEQRAEEEALYKDYVDLPIIDSIMNIYLMSLGDFDTRNYQKGSQSKDWPIWLIFVLMTCITNIVFINMLIAIMSDTYDRVMERVKQAGLKE